MLAPRKNNVGTLVEHPWAIAFGLILLIEGIIPFLFPKQWRQTVLRISRMSDGQIRFLGMIALLFGSILLGVVHVFS